MIRLFVPHDLASGATLDLDEGQSRYLAAVMRLAEGDELLVFNGRDGEWRARVQAVRKKAVSLEAVAQSRPQAIGPDLDLVIALVKRARLETIVEKAAELGARRVRPVITERTNADHTRVDRLQTIAVEASEQTGRLDVPEVTEPVKLERLLAGWDEGRRLLFCDEAGDAAPLLEARFDRTAQQVERRVLTEQRARVARQHGSGRLGARGTEVRVETGLRVRIELRVGVLRRRLRPRGWLRLLEASGAGPRVVAGRRLAEHAQARAEQTAAPRAADPGPRILEPALEACGSEAHGRPQHRTKLRLVKRSRGWLDLAASAWPATWRGTTGVGGRTASAAERARVRNED